MRLAVLVSCALLAACSTPYPCVELGGSPAPDGTCYYDEYDAGSDASTVHDASIDAPSDAATPDAATPDAAAADAGEGGDAGDAGEDAGDASLDAGTELDASDASDAD